MAQTCPECGMTPMGSACYHICSNSDHFYSPEQERADAPFYGDDDQRERYAAEMADLDREYDDEPDVPIDMPVIPPVDTSDDIPF